MRRRRTTPRNEYLRYKEWQYSLRVLALYYILYSTAGRFPARNFIRAAMTHRPGRGLLFGIVQINIAIVPMKFHVAEARRARARLDVLRYVTRRLKHIRSVRGKKWKTCKQNRNRIATAPARNNYCGGWRTSSIGPEGIDFPWWNHVECWKCSRNTMAMFAASRGLWNGDFGRRCRGLRYETLSEIYILIKHDANNRLRAKSFV